MSSAALFDQLKALLTPYAKHLTVTADTPTNYMLNCKTLCDGKPLYFGGVSVRKNYTSFYFFPRYMYPELNELIAQPLEKMAGKSCFNIKKLDSEMLASLKALTKAGFERFKAEKLL